MVLLSMYLIDKNLVRFMLKVIIPRLNILSPKKNLSPTTGKMF